MQRALVLSASLLFACAVPDDTSSTDQELCGGPATVNVQILGINDFHGNLEAPEGANGQVTIGFDSLGKPITVSAGGAGFLATHIDELRAQNENTVVVSSGDLIGASPLVSALFHDEPTIEVFNAIGLDFNGVGNHEFDEGPAELLRMQNGGCNPIDGCADGDGFSGSTFQFLAADVYRANNHTLFPPFKVRSFGGAKVAFIGMTLHDTPSIVSPAGVEGLTFTDEASTANALVHYLQTFGVHTFVVLVHQGGGQTGVGSGIYDDCVGLTGPIVDIVNNLDPAVKVVLSAHTHNAYNCTINGRIVTSAASFGRLITKVDLTLDRDTGDVTAATAHNVIVSRDVAQDPTVKAIVDRYLGLSAALANRVVGSITSDIRRIYKIDGTTRDDGKESPLGDVIADAQLASTAAPTRGGSQIAFMNPGGIRADLMYTSSSAGEGDGNVTYKEAFTVQPFANVLATITLTGQQIKAVLEQQFGTNQPPGGRVLQVSSGFSYVYSASAPIGSKISSMMLNGAPIDLSASYRVTINGFLADGGDNFTAFKQGTSRLGGDVDIDALVAYLTAQSPVPPGPANRITVAP
ncbi:MAG TPA: bifunctional metallophosphatase/5'-nucleotidase [Kofleriaceae bacterium]